MPSQTFSTPCECPAEICRLYLCPSISHHTRPQPAPPRGKRRHISCVRAPKNHSLAISELFVEYSEALLYNEPLRKLECHACSRNVLMCPALQCALNPWGLLLAGADCNCSVPQGDLDIPEVLGGEAVQSQALDCDACWRWGLCFLYRLELPQTCWCHEVVLRAH